MPARGNEVEREANTRAGVMLYTYVRPGTVLRCLLTR